MNTDYNPVNYGFSQGCGCFSFATLILLILIVLQFSNKKYGKNNSNDDDDDYYGDRKHGDNKKYGYQDGNIIDNSILFIIAFFLLVCGCGRYNCRY